MPGIKERTDICYRKSLIFLAIGRKNNIPFYFIDIPAEPGHTFIRYDPDAKHDPLNPDNPINKDDINIETTAEGIFSDQFYINEYHLSKKSLEKNTKKFIQLEMLRIRCLSKRSFEYYEIDESEKAAADYGIVREFIRNLYK